MGLGGIRKGQMRNPSQEMHTRRRCTPGKNCVTCSAKFLHLAITLGGCILISSILSHMSLLHSVFQSMRLYVLLMLCRVLKLLRDNPIC